jgi:cytochrome c553
MDSLYLFNIIIAKIIVQLVTFSRMEARMKILFLALATLLFLGCSQEKQKESQKAEATQTAHKAPVKETVVKETAVKVIPKAVDTNKTAVVVEEKATVVTKAAIKSDKAPVIEKEVVEVKEVKTEVVPQEVAVVQKVTVDGAAVFKKCVGCHGMHAEKKALGKSQVIKGWDTQKILTALHGYKDGTYGGTMKSIMKGQVSKLSDDEIKAVAEYISKL